MLSLFEIIFEEQAVSSVHMMADNRKGQGLDRMTGSFIRSADSEMGTLMHAAAIPAPVVLS